MAKNKTLSSAKSQKMKKKWLKVGVAMLLLVWLGAGVCARRDVLYLIEDFCMNKNGAQKNGRACEKLVFGVGFFTEGEWYNPMVIWGDKNEEVAK